jgi:hypothetical protein
MPFTFELNEIKYEIHFVDTSNTALYSNNSSASLGTHWCKISKIYIDETLE